MRILLAILCMIAGVAGCGSAPSIDDAPRPAPTMSAIADETPATPPAITPVTADPAATSLQLLTAELNSARLAARKVETLPAVHDALARREILLNVALYRAAFDTRVSRQLRYVVLEPVFERNPPDTGIEPVEFRLRILGALDDLPVPVAWITETWRSGGIDYFPDTYHRATRLRISILERNEDNGTVLGQVGDWTSDLGASRQKVTCTWDGLTWNVDRDSVRMVW